MVTADSFIFISEKTLFQRKIVLEFTLQNGFKFIPSPAFFSNLNSEKISKQPYL